MKINIAAAQYEISFLADWQAYADKIEYWIKQARTQNAEILLFPEYAAMELASLFPSSVYVNLPKQLQALQSVLDDYLDLIRKLAEKYQCYILPGSFPVRISSNEYRNRAYFFTPNGYFYFQEKLQMTRFESEQWMIKNAQELKVFSGDFGKIGINICYDSEFPMFARMQVEAGANIIMVPSCTDTLAGYHRVRIACQARALENQCYVVQAPLVGKAAWSPAVDINTGAAAVFGPVDNGFPDDGVIARGQLNEVGWIFAELCLEKIASVRQNGQVCNYHDWPKQFNITLRRH